MARLQERGYLATTTSVPARETTVSVAPAGRRAAAAATRAWARAQQATTELLGPDGLAALDLLVARIEPNQGAA